MCVCVCVCEGGGACVYVCVYVYIFGVCMVPHPQAHSQFFNVAAGNGPGDEGMCVLVCVCTSQ